MNKYVRTKDEIFELYAQEKRLYGDYISTKHKHYRYDCVIKQADTIEELCDKFVIIRNPNYHNEYLFEDFFDDVLDFIKWCKDYCVDYCIYGAIWTEKGLIYVAKMNEKGELELI